MDNIGGIFGLIGIVSIFFLAIRPGLILVVDQMKASGKKLPDPLKKIYQFVNKTHRYAGFVAVGAVILHFTLQYAKLEFVSVPGLIAAMVLIIQAVLGFGLTKQKDKARRRKMALLHRVLGVLLVLAVLNHRIFRLGS